MTTTGVTVEVCGLSKRYGDVVAVDDLSFEVGRGEIFGILGPNGAGKTTVVECLTTLRGADRGRVRVLGLDPQRDALALRPRIGVQLQRTTLHERIKVWEALDLFASFYPKSRDQRELLLQLGLAERADVPFGQLSGGQRQRVFVALALIHAPEIVFLDELTTSLDPQARHAIWDLIREMRDRGVTVVLTTHFMEEAEHLCERVAILSRGKMVALGAPGQLVRGCGAGRRVSFRAEASFDMAKLASIAGVDRVACVDGRVVVEGRDDGLAVDIVAVLTAAGVRCRELQTEQPTLEQVFLELTGERLGNEP